MLMVATSFNVFAASDPWVSLQEKFKKPALPVPKVQPETKKDPWGILRAVFLPFSLEEEERAIVDAGAAKSLAQKINSRMAPFEEFIAKASKTFDIPVSVIKSVIMAESGANPDAKAKLSSAKGLMQTIDSTFQMARKGLLKIGIIIKNNPFDSQSSIMAGSWYLDRMYKKALADKKIKISARSNIVSWRYPLEYYYAGPVHGVKAKNKILVFSKGKKRVIDKRAYSKKIEVWARILERS